ncbi:hypothetical protein EDC01DRAFT_778470 [Geopyxis carbonaria]|nr:hypothetical protein EDC01DRAFT_778470 [Geopyxis carbonaria]
MSFFTSTTPTSTPPARSSTPPTPSPMTTTSAMSSPQTPTPQRSNPSPSTPANLYTGLQTPNSSPFSPIPRARPTPTSRVVAVSAAVAASYEATLKLHKKLLTTSVKLLTTQLPGGLPPHAVPVRHRALGEALKAAAYPRCENPRPVPTNVNLCVYRIFGALENADELLAAAAHAHDLCCGGRGIVHPVVDWQSAEIAQCPVFKRQWRNVLQTVELLEKTMSGEIWKEEVPVPVVAEVPGAFDTK